MSGPDVLQCTVIVLCSNYCLTKEGDSSVSSPRIGAHVVEERPPEPLENAPLADPSSDDDKVAVRCEASATESIPFNSIYKAD